MNDTVEVEGKLPWHDREKWTIPKQDTRCRTLEEGPKDFDKAIEIIRPNLRNNRIAIQSGGYFGFWSIGLSKYFAEVHTFEPEKTNYKCLRKNTSDINNIYTYNYALSSERKMVNMKTDEERNAGAFYITEGDEVQSIKIDDIGLKDVDLIYLDIEGSEYDALKGAEMTIDEYHPIIGVEKKWQGRYHDINLVQFIKETFNYKVIGKPNHLDVILAHV